MAREMISYFCMSMFLYGFDPADLSTTQSSELDFRTSFVGSDELPEIDHDGAEFARMLLAQAEQEQKDSEAEEVSIAVTGMLPLSCARGAAEDDYTSRETELITLAAEMAGPLTSKDRCRYYNKGRTRCKRSATGLDGRCAIHKLSQFCKYPKCSKFNQGVGYCIKHGGGKKCKQDGCDKQVQGYGFCSGHGGKPLCPMEGCENKRMEGG